MSGTDTLIDFDARGEIRFRYIGPWNFYREPHNRVNATTWCGHPPGTVLLFVKSIERLPDIELQSWDDPDSYSSDEHRVTNPNAVHDFVFTPAPPPIVIADGPTLEITKIIPASERYGTADFNEFDFGEVVT